MTDQNLHIYSDPLEHFRERAEIALAMLTPQQKKILEIAATDPGHGKENTNEVIATLVGLSSSSIEKHIRNARKVIGGSDRDGAIKQFIVMRTLIGTRNSDFRAMDVTPEVIEEAISQVSPELAVRLHGSPQLEQLATELRGGGGWKFLDLKFGRPWRLLIVPIGAALLIILLGGILSLANAADRLNGSGSSSTQVGEQHVGPIKPSSDDQ